jgi:hypothetical protein
MCCSVSTGRTAAYRTRRPLGQHNAHPSDDRSAALVSHRALKFPGSIWFAMAVPQFTRACRIMGPLRFRYIDNGLASWLGPLGRLGWIVIRISLPALRVLRNPLNRVIFRNEPLDDFRFAIGP